MPARKSGTHLSVRKKTYAVASLSPLAGSSSCFAVATLALAGCRRPRASTPSSLSTSCTHCQHVPSAGLLSAAPAKHCATPAAARCVRCATAANPQPWCCARCAIPAAHIRLNQIKQK
nr:unnamed protein product [Digitaria exilis]